MNLIEDDLEEIELTPEEYDLARQLDREAMGKVDYRIDMTPCRPNVRGIEQRPDYPEYRAQRNRELERQRYQRDIEKRRQVSLDQYYKNREERIEKVKSYYQDNREERIIKQRAYYQKNRERINARRREAYRIRKMEEQNGM